MADTGSYDVRGSHRDIPAEIERLAAQARQGWGKEARTLRWLGLADGMSVLELGSGPGFITEQLRALVPASPIVCVEADGALLEQAARYLGESAAASIRFVEGSVMDMPLEADQFDIAYARFLFQHLADPVGAAREIWRVLRPGGKLIIHDIDDELFGIFQPPIPELPLVVEQFGRAQAARGGNRRISRALWRTLEAAGFGNMDLEVLASHSDGVGIAPFLRQIDPDRMVSLVNLGLLTAEDLERFRASHSALAAAPEPYALWLSFLVSGEKPR